MYNKALKRIYSILLPLLPNTLVFFNSSCNQYNDNIILNYSCTGVVIKKYINYSNHAARTLWVQGKGGRNDICYITTNSKDSIYLYNKVTIGDSIIKKPGNKTYRIKSHKKNFIYTYKYE